MPVRMGEMGIMARAIDHDHPAIGEHFSGDQRMAAGGDHAVLGAGDDDDRLGDLAIAAVPARPDGC